MGPRASLDVCGGRKPLIPTRIQKPDCPACSLVAIPPMLQWILLHTEKLNAVLPHDLKKETEKTESHQLKVK